MQTVIARCEWTYAYKMKPFRTYLDDVSSRRNITEQEAVLEELETCSANTDCLLLVKLLTV